jgi:lipopolysaccharide transport system permease protein
MNFKSEANDDRPVRVIRPAPSSIELVVCSLASLWARRSLLIEMTMLRLKVRYRQSVLGWVWAVLQPFLLMVAYTLIFFKVVGVKSDELPYALFIFSGLVPWTFFSTSVSTATAGIVAHRYLISRIAFPREIVPLSYVLAAFPDLGIGLLMLAAMMSYFEIAPSVYVFLAIPVVAMLVICSAAAALFCSAFQARFRDVGAGMPLLLQVMMFSAPVVYSSSAIPDDVKQFYFVNPLAIQIDAFRQAIVLGVSPNVGAIVYCGTASFVFLCLSYVLFKRLDLTLADVI